MELTVTFAGVPITARWDVDYWDLYHIPHQFRARVAALLDAERDRLRRDDYDPCSDEHSHWGYC